MLEASSHARGNKDTSAGSAKELLGMQISGEISFRIIVDADNEDEAMELVESDFGILNDDERVDLNWRNVS